MTPSLIFFLCVSSFLAGTAFSGLGLAFLFLLIPVAILFAALYASGERLRVALLAALMLIAGGLYYYANDYRYQSLVAQVPKTADAQGLIVSDPQVSADSQSFYLQMDFGKVSIMTDPDPAYSYGDTLQVSGAIERPPDNYYGNYLAEANAVGSMRNPLISPVSSGGGNSVFAFLFRIKRAISDSFARLLLPDEAALLSGVTLGINSGFSQAFLQNLSLSGTRHLTAISGLHLAILMFIIFSALAYVLPRRYAFIATIASATFFVALTGFSPSAVRAALMGSIAGLAAESGRMYAPHNALALAALALVLPNPKIMIFDVGFELSFLAAVSMIYFSPIVRRALRLGGDAGFAGWKQSLAATISAQLATAPLLITQFQNFSLIAFVANILVLGVIPFVIVLGFIMAIASFLFPYLAIFISWFIAPLLSYVIVVVNLFAKYAILFDPPLGFTGVAVYYIFLLCVLYRFSEKREPKAFSADKNIKLQEL